MSLNIAQRLLPGWGVTYGPPGDGPFPTIMLLHSSEGAWAGWSHRDAMLFAAHGFLAFPYGYSSGGNACFHQEFDKALITNELIALSRNSRLPFMESAVLLLPSLNYGLTAVTSNSTSQPGLTRASTTMAERTGRLGCSSVPKNCV